VGDGRAELPASEVLGLVYAIWRRAYRIRFPLQSDVFCYMIEQMENVETVGVDPAFVADAGE
jgi:hypothetical protein